MAMYEFGKGKNINLQDNETTEKDFAKIGEVENFVGIGNKVKTTSPTGNGFSHFLKTYFFNPISITIIAILTSAVIYSYFPFLKKLVT